MKSFIWCPSELSAEARANSGVQTRLRAVGGTQAVTRAQKLALLWEESVSNCFTKFSIIWKHPPPGSEEILIPRALVLVPVMMPGQKAWAQAGMGLLCEPLNGVVPTQDEAQQPQCPHIIKASLSKPAMHFWK